MMSPEVPPLEDAFGRIPKATPRVKSPRRAGGAKASSASPPRPTSSRPRSPKKAPAPGKSAQPAKPSAPPRAVNIAEDTRVNFPAYFVGKPTQSKVDRRKFIADYGLLWLRLQKARGKHGACVFDIDHTILDGNESVIHGFEAMRDMYEEMRWVFPVHIVTARPDDQYDNVIQLLKDRGFSVSPDRLHLLPADQYDGPLENVERFKWKKHQEFVKMHGAVLARFGDKMWDVAHGDSLHTYLAHVHDEDSYVFFDPRLGGTLSGKLPG